MHLEVDVTTLLSSYELETSRLKHTCDDILFVFVTGKMMSYQQLAPVLGVTGVEVYEIEQNNAKDYRLQKQKFLELWRTKKGSGATIYSLVDAFLEVDDRKTAEAIVAYIQISISCKKSNPDNVFPEKAVLCYPKWNDMSEEEKKKIKEKLVIENFVVQKKFGMCLREIAESFEKRRVCLSDLKMKLEAFKIPSELASATEVKQIFYIISQHSSFFNFGILEAIVEDLGNEEERQLLSEYKDNVLKPYLQKSIFEIPLDSISTSATKSSHIKLCLKLVDKPDLSANEAILIKHNLSQYLALPSLELAHYDDDRRLFFAVSQEDSDTCLVNSPLVVWDEDSSSYVIADDIMPKL